MNVLIFSKEAKWQGGVVNFIETLKNNLATEIKADQFLIGGKKDKSKKLLKLFWPVFDATRLVFIVLAGKYDVYHLNPSLNAQSLYRDGLFLIIVRLFSNKRILVSFHGWEKSTEKTIKNSFFLSHLFKWAYNKADCTLVLARPFKDWLCKQGFSANKVHLFTTMFDGDVLKGVRRKQPNEAIHLLFLSRFVKEKGIYELLEVFKKLHCEHDNLYLNFAGAGGEEQEMKAWVAKNNLKSVIHFYGYVRDEDKANVFANSDIFVFPTYYGEGCPVSLLEAMATGLGIVTTPVGGIPDIITSKMNGILIDENVKTQQLYDAIDELVTNRDYLDKMKEANFKQAWQRYEAPIVAKQFSAFYYEQ
ncbi:MAG: glycosyltransferase family 4 protein [Methylococcales bacterium]